MGTQRPIVMLADERTAVFTAEGLVDVDHALFRAPFVLVAKNNKSVGTVATLDDAHRALAGQGDVATYVATLESAYLGMDIDPSDRQTDPEAGEAASDALVSWCERRGLAWLRRVSGRHGHRHIVAKIPQDLREALRVVARDIAGHHGVSITVRSSLRPLRAPHRLGLPATMIDGTVDQSDFVSRNLPRPGLSVTAARHSSWTKPRGQQVRRSPKHSRSEEEFGETLARIRAGWDEAASWTAVNRQGSKAAEVGRHAWRRWVWAPAVTLVDAERNVHERHAWENFCRASSEQGRHLGYDGWFQSRWLPAVAEAARDRPRRLRTSPGGNPASRESSRQQDDQSLCREVETVARVLVLVARERAAARGRLLGGVKLETLCIAVAALAKPIVAREGSISVRSWAEAALLDPKTIRRARDAAVELGLIWQSRAYQGDAADCDAWLPTADVAKTIEQWCRGDNSPTGRYAPHRDQVGRADPMRLKRTHADERCRWLLWLTERVSRLKMVFRLNDEQLATSQVVAAIARQRKWWKSLSVEEKECRRRLRRKIIGRMPVGVRARWLVWLRRRKDIVAAGDRVLTDCASAADWTVLRGASNAIHLGLRKFE